MVIMIIIIIVIITLILMEYDRYTIFTVYILYIYIYLYAHYSRLKTSKFHSSKLIKKLGAGRQKLSLRSIIMKQKQSLQIFFTEKKLKNQV